MDKRGMNWISWPLEHYSITLLIIIILFVLGLFGMYEMPKDEFPAFTIRQGVVVAVYPGATTEEVEEQVTKPLERYLFTYGEVDRKKTTTTSQNGMSIVMLRLNDDVNNKDEVWSKIKHGLTTFKQTLPSGVLALIANDDFGNTSALLIAIESSQRSYRELQEYTDQVSDRLRRIPSVANVRVYGAQKEQISLYVDRQRLQAYGIGQQTLFSRLQAQGMTTMSGALDDNDQQVPIHIQPTESSEEEIANQIIFSDPVSGKVARVRDVAKVVREYDKGNSYIEQDGHPCVLLSLEMTPGNNIVQYGKEVDDVLNEYRSNVLPDDVTITRIAESGGKERERLPSRPARFNGNHHPGDDGAVPVAVGHRRSHNDSNQYFHLRCGDVLHGHRAQHRHAGGTYCRPGNGGRQLHRRHRRLFGVS